MKMITTLALAALALSFAAPADAAGRGTECKRFILVNGKKVDIVRGLPEGKCLVRTISLRGRDCPSGKAEAEPMSEDALRKHPVRGGEEAGYHFVCLAGQAVTSQDEPPRR